MSTSAVTPPRWAVYSTFVLSLIGLGLSAFLTYAHFHGTSILACSNAATLVDCAAVTTSQWSYLFGIPVAVLGLINFIIMVGLNSPWGWKITNYWINLGRFVLSIGGMIFVLWLVYCELVKINHLCLYCTGVHIVSFVLLVILTRVSPAQLGWVSTSAQE